MFDFLIRCMSVFALLFLTAAASAQPPVILVFGDSLSAGYGLPQGKGWVDLLRQRLQQISSPYQVVNASISGETTLGGRGRLAGVLAAHRPQIVILELGANDGLRGQSLTEMRDNLMRMVRDAQAAKARVLVVGMRIPPNYGPDYTKKFQAIYLDVARQTKAEHVPFLMAGFADKRDMFQADGVHPAIEAQAQMLDNVWSKLSPLVSRTDSLERRAAFGPPRPKSKS
jgi:acyl-CoA thioesterase-1